MDFATVLARLNAVAHLKGIVPLLHTYNVYSDFEKASNHFFQHVTPFNTEIHPLLFADLVNNYFFFANEWMQSTAQPHHTENDRVMLMHFITSMISEAIHFAHIERQVYCDILKERMLIESNTMSWNDLIFYIFVGEIELKKMPGNKKIQETSLEVSPNPATYFVWQVDAADKESHISLDAFIYDLTSTFPGVKNKKTIALLFDPQAQDYYITVPNEHLHAFLTVFHKLHRCKRIKCMFTRGLYLHLQPHLQAPQHEKLPSRKNYYKLVSEAQHDSKMNLQILRKTKDLLDKYSLKG